MPVAGDEIRGCVWLGGFERPKENAAVFGAAEEGFAIGRKGHGPNFVEVAFERTQMRVGVGVPKLNRMIPTSGGEDFAVGRKRGGSDGARMQWFFVFWN